MYRSLHLVEIVTICFNKISELSDLSIKGLQLNLVPHRSSGSFLIKSANFM